MKPYNIFRNEQIEIKAPADQDTLTKKFTQEALQFIDNNAEQPFFLYYAQPFPHHPLHTSPEFRGSSQAGIYGDAVQEIDWSVGQIVAKLKEKGIFENTLLLFTSDNGPWHEGNPGYHRGRKHLPFDGGMKVPMIASWPSRIKQKTECNSVWMNIRLFSNDFGIVEY